MLNQGPEMKRREFLAGLAGIAFTPKIASAETGGNSDLLSRFDDLYQRGVAIFDLRQDLVEQPSQEAEEASELASLAYRYGAELGKLDEDYNLENIAPEDHYEDKIRSTIQTFLKKNASTAPSVVIDDLKQLVAMLAESLGAAPFHAQQDNGLTQEQIKEIGEMDMVIARNIFCGYYPERCAIS